MNDAEIDGQIANLEAAIETLRSMKRAVQAAGPPGRFITPGQASEFAGGATQIRRDCQDNPLDCGGFGLKLGGRWLVEEARYRTMRADARFKR